MPKIMNISHFLDKGFQMPLRLFCQAIHPIQKSAQFDKSAEITLSDIVRERNEGKYLRAPSQVETFALGNVAPSETCLEFGGNPK